MCLLACACLDDIKYLKLQVRAASLLVRRFHVSPKCVAVLSQYRAQCVDIEKELLKRGEKEIPVSTVVAAQGAFQNGFLKLYIINQPQNLMS